MVPFRLYVRRELYQNRLKSYREMGSTVGDGTFPCAVTLFLLTLSKTLLANVIASLSHDTTKAEKVTIFQGFPVFENSGNFLSVYGKIK